MDAPALAPHQREAVDAVTRLLRQRRGAILADEVGLGKSFVAAEVMHRFEGELELVVPASLRKQWQQELSEKFSLDSTIMEAGTYKEMRAKGHARPFAAIRGVIISSTSGSACTSLIRYSR